MLLNPKKYTNKSGGLSSPTRELLHATAPVLFIAQKDKESNSVFVKGFASVEKEDRSKDLVSPEEFDIKQFMASPVLFVNHQPWRDNYGNGVAAGRPTALNAAKLATIKGDTENWGVQDLATNEIINTYPKAKVPNLQEGDKGLFVVAEVTHPEVAKMVLSGELGSFSWRGLATLDYKIGSESQVVKTFIDIDLYEISLVHVPDNVNATFIVGKSVQSVALSKTIFESEGLAKEYLNRHSLNASIAGEDVSNYYSCQYDYDAFESGKLEAIKMAEGVQIIAGPLSELHLKSKEAAIPFSWVGKVLSTEWVNALSNLFSKSNSPEIIKEKSVANATTETKVEESAAKATETTSEQKTETQKTTNQESKKDAADCGPGTAYNKETMKCEKTKEAQALDALGDHVATKAAEGVVTGLKPLFDGMITNLDTLSKGFTLIAEKMANLPGVKESNNQVNKTETEKPKTETQKTANVDGLASVLNALSATLVSQQTQIAEVSKSVEAYGKLTPSQTVREEKLEVEKRAKTDPNSCFDSLFAFSGKGGGE